MIVFPLIRVVGLKATGFPTYDRTSRLTRVVLTNRTRPI